MSFCRFDTASAVPAGEEVFEKETPAKGDTAEGDHDEESKGLDVGKENDKSELDEI